MVDKNVCIVDFCGNIMFEGWHTEGSFCADWNGEFVYFNGLWAHVPNMPCTQEPTEDEVDAWARKHGGFIKGLAVRDALWGYMKMLTEDRLNELIQW